ncbi:MAG: ABC transporter permease [Actinomycetota bacterium]
MAIAERRRQQRLAEERTAKVTTSEGQKLHPVSRLKELWQFREILANLTRKEVKVKYTSSVLGAAWAMLNPLLFLLVFWFVFGLVLKNGLPQFPVYILSGILAWNLYNSSLALSARSVVDNANLVKKVYFPREILPLSTIGVALVDFVFQAVVLVIFLLIEWHNPWGLNLVLLPLSIAALLLFVVALSFLVSALNVKYRDTQHLLNLALVMWFWLTPVVYPMATMQDRIVASRHFGVPWLYAYLILNPMATVLAGFQRAVYKVVTPVVHNPDGTTTTTRALLDFSIAKQAVFLGIVCALSVGLILLTWRHFFRQSGDFAEEL